MEFALSPVLDGPTTGELNDRSNRYFDKALPGYVLDVSESEWESRSGGELESVADDQA